ncbi:MAG: pyruvate kinase [Holosporales bacterium]|jgi:pyruvate kinase|nr:pyruvate kinase [Holosporales bacterium]
MQANRKTKIVATLGPSSSSEEMIRKLAVAGVDVFRLNFSHGNYETHKNNANLIRRTENSLDKKLKIMMDLQGPKIRIGAFEDKSVSLKTGAKFILDITQRPGDSTRVSLPHPEIFSSLRPGTELLLDDGKLKLEVCSNNGSVMETKVIVGGVLSSNKGVNIPNAALPISSLTDKDKNDITTIKEIDADWLAVSFIQTAEDIKQARKFVGDNNISILAKIEKPSAVENIDSIIEAADIIMAARGDLGVELPYESIPGIQNMIVSKAKFYKKPVVVATHMLESMTRCPVPTRAEVSDVAYAVAQGADAVMLSAETASGLYPEQAVQAMNKIVVRAEKDKITFGNFQG